MLFTYTEDEMIAICKEIGELNATFIELKAHIDPVERDVLEMVEVGHIELDALTNRIKNYTQVEV